MAFDDNRSRTNDSLFDHGCWLDDRRRLRRLGRDSLQFRDNVFANALLVQRDDVRHGDRAHIAALTNLRDDDLIAQPATRHGDDVVHRDGGCALLLYLILLLGLVVHRTLTRQLGISVGCISQEAPGNRADHAADHGTCAGFVVLITDQTTSDRAGDASQGRAALLSRLRESDRAGQAKDDDRPKIR